MKLFTEFQNPVCRSLLPWWVHNATVRINLKKYNTITISVLTSISITIFTADIVANLIIIIIFFIISISTVAFTIVYSTNTVRIIFFVVCLTVVVNRTIILKFIFIFFIVAHSFNANINAAISNTTHHSFKCFAGDAIHISQSRIVIWDEAPLHSFIRGSFQLKMFKIFVLREIDDGRWEHTYLIFLTFIITNKNRCLISNNKLLH